MGETCEICFQPLWQDHTFCEALIMRQEANHLELQERSKQLLRDNPWLGLFQYEYDKWQSARSISES